MKKEQQQELALLLFMQGITKKDIAIKIGVSEKTIGTWSEKFAWKEKRAGNQITRSQLINKTLQEINKLFETSNGNINADALIKLANVIEKLDKQPSVVDFMQTFLKFSEWCISRAEIDNALTTELIKNMTKYQDIFINENFQNN